MIEKHKVCFNCGALMTWDLLTERYVCNYCGNADPSDIELKRRERSYIN